MTPGLGIIFLSYSCDYKKTCVAHEISFKSTRNSPHSALITIGIAPILWNLPSTVKSQSVHFNNIIGKCKICQAVGNKKFNVIEQNYVWVIPLVQQVNKPLNNYVGTVVDFKVLAKTNRPPITHWGTFWVCSPLYGYILVWIWTF